MKHFCFILFIAIVNPVFSQTKKVYLTKDGQFSSDPKLGISYILEQKLEGDSAFKVSQYDMHDTILVSGTYKDESLSIPNGKFNYYCRQHQIIWDGRNSSSAPVDTNNYLKSSGYYLNGLKEGVWVEFSSRNVKSAEYTFEAGKLNGHYKVTDGFLGYRSEGNYVNNLIQGKVYTYTTDSLLAYEMDYENGKTINTTVHLHPARKKEDFDKYLERRLHKYYTELVNNPPIVEFTVGKNGEVLNIQIVKGINPKIDSLIVQAFRGIPNYTPANLDYVPVSQRITTQLFLFQYLNNVNFTYSVKRNQPGIKSKVLHTYTVPMGNNGLVMVENEYD